MYGTTDFFHTLGSDFCLAEDLGIALEFQTHLSAEESVSIIDLGLSTWQGAPAE